jgi:membrane associated rhomboid family serine protease
MRLHYNSPVILTFALISSAVMLASNGTGGAMTMNYFSIAPTMLWSDPATYLRLFSHVIGHANWEHLVSNFSLILLIGPLLEEKYGSQLMLIMILVTALLTAIINTLFFSTGLLGASGIVFMLILLSSFASVRAGSIPLTFIIIVILYLGREFSNTLRADNISQFAHILGGICGGAFGFLGQRMLGAADAGAASKSAGSSTKSGLDDFTGFSDSMKL